MVIGGGLACLAPTSEWLTLVLSDVVGNPLDAIASGPTVPDSTTWQDAANVLERYSLWHRVPSPVAARIQAGLRGDIPDTPKPGAALFQRGAVHIVGSNLRACEAAASEATRRGFKTLVLTTFLEGEAREVGRLLAAFLREVHASGHPVPRPCCLVAGGETTVTLQGRGKGGRNQELALSAATVLEDLPDILLVSIGPDGSDGPTDAAGAIVDGTTMRRARECGLSAADFLARNDSYALFERLGDLVITGPTQTNVNDLYLLFAFEQAP
jgi:hydroxypyruvate reductase